MNRVTVVTCAILYFALLAGCAQQRIIIDKKGVSMQQYLQDKAECETYAEEVSIAASAGTGAARGAVLGGAIGAIFGNANTAARGAGAGAVSGGAGGASKAEREKLRVVKNCLVGRGYRVLN
ncbi:MAG: glycine zipper family protein [Exilibacterium sp.]